MYASLGLNEIHINRTPNPQHAFNFPVNMPQWTSSATLLHAYVVNFVLFSTTLPYSCSAYSGHFAHCTTGVGPLTVFPPFRYFPGFRNYQNVGYIQNITYIKCHRSLSLSAPVKYQCDLFHVILQNKNIHITEIIQRSFRNRRPWIPDAIILPPWWLVKLRNISRLEQRADNLHCHI